MLPNKVHQIDYQEYCMAVESHLSAIESFAQESKTRFACVLAVGRGGDIAASLIAEGLAIPRGQVFVEEDIDLSAAKDGMEILASKKEAVLLASPICGSGESLLRAKEFLQEKFGRDLKVFSYATFVKHGCKVPPDIIGITNERFFQPPWEWKSFTPQAHLARLMGESVDIKDLPNAICFSSQSVKDKIEESMGKRLKGEWLYVFPGYQSGEKVTTTSGITSVDVHGDIPIEDYREHLSPLIAEKVRFILSNGYTHFIEESLNQSLLLSQLCPTCRIMHFDGKRLCRIYAKDVLLDDLFD